MHRPIELESVVETHERPFAVIDDNFTVVMVNGAYEQAFRAGRAELVGRKCHQVLHRRDRPCFEEGEECPFLRCFSTRQPGSCLHTHYDGQGRPHWVRIDLYPLQGADGRTYIGEALQEIADGAERDVTAAERLVGNSPALLRALEQLERAAAADAPVLLVGETGTGKELAAGFLHRRSPRAAQPFVAVDCTVVTETLFESEVFGHERGAFTGSVATRKGLCEAAGEGTLFFDEIGEAGLPIQAKLLRLLESGEYRRVGGNRRLEARARVVCATNRDLAEQVRTGAFRQDLYHRIACFLIRLPPLRERLGDLPLLCEHILARLGGAAGMSYRVTGDALRCLARQRFPGNVRELRNILQVAVAHLAQGGGGVITRAHIEQCLQLRGELEARGAAPVVACASGDGLVNYAAFASSRALARYETWPAVAGPVQAEVAGDGATLRELEAMHIEDLLRQHRGNRKRVAVALGISERTLYRKLKRYGLADVR